ncbi:hypothetical protein CTEN210_03273 [Chaetoceros tenuissimus]|uniref:Arp2/3 complex 34 kDa subunit n=1 Tax=Chaetoceros tenuissimus TaxID=426638 RepID=A0AAD3CL78_9STRA|nr:hypothetical protein CTEN210_03273 [Chaetoceros tenuissimus]
MEIPIHHEKVRLLLEKFLLHDIRNETASSEVSHCFYNFGAKIKVVVKGDKLAMYLYFTGWDHVQDSVVNYLQNLIGEESESKVLVDKEVPENYSVCILLHKEGKYGKYFCRQLSEVPMILGANLKMDFDNLRNGGQSLQSHIYQIPLQNKQCAASITVQAYEDRIVCILPFVYLQGQETDCIIANTILKQFQQAQRNALSQGKNVPFCDYSRWNDPPAELKAFTEDYTSGGKTHAGFLKFTFLHHHLSSKEKVRNSVGTLLMLNTLVNKSVKETKSRLSARMRKKKDELESMLFQV